MCGEVGLGGSVCGEIQEIGTGFGIASFVHACVACSPEREVARALLCVGRSTGLGSFSPLPSRTGSGLPQCALERLVVLLGRVGGSLSLPLFSRLLAVVTKVVDTLGGGRAGDLAPLLLTTLCRCTGNLCCLFTHASGEPCVVTIPLLCGKITLVSPSLFLH